MKDNPYQPDCLSPDQCTWQEDGKCIKTYTLYCKGGYQAAPLNHPGIAKSMSIARQLQHDTEAAGYHHTQRSI